MLAMCYELAVEVNPLIMAMILEVDRLLDNLKKSKKKITQQENHD